MSDDSKSSRGKATFPRNDDPPRWAKNKTELAAILKAHIGVGTRQTIANWQRDFPDDCPRSRSNGQYLVSEWIDFAGEISAGESRGEISQKTQLENEKLREQIARLRFRRECDQNLWTPNAIIADEVRRLVAEAVAVLRDELETKAPVELRERNRAALDKAMSRLHRGADDLAQKFPPQPVAVIEEEGIVARIGT